MDVQTLKELGLDQAAETLDQKIQLKQKLMVAYEHYRFVEPQVINAFQEQLKKKTFKREQHDQYHYTDSWRQLKFMALKEYPHIPPTDCLMDLKKAKEMNCFDSFEVVMVEEVVNNYDTTPVPDPILFGLIDGCVDRFFITQWDDDCSIEEILKESEG
jgi:hypothetical protein